MENKFKILFGGLLVWIICMLSMVANYPTIYSPYSLTVVIPTLYASALDLPGFFVYLFGSLPLTAFYFAFSFFTINKHFVISKPTIILTCIFVLLSIAFNIMVYKYGVKYQGLLHTLLMYGYNVFFIALLALIYKRNKSAPTFYGCLGFNIVLFSWLGWVAFPWLGELI